MSDTKRPKPAETRPEDETERDPDELAEGELEKASGGARFGDITLKRGVDSGAADPIPTEQISMNYEKITFKP